MHPDRHSTPPRPSLLMSVAVLVMVGIGLSHWLRLSHDTSIPLVPLSVVLAVAMACCLLRRTTLPMAVTGVAMGALLDTLQWRQYDAEECETAAVYEAVIVNAPIHREKSTQVKVRLTGHSLSPVMLTTLRDTTLQRDRHLLFSAELQKVHPAWHQYFHYGTWLFHQGVYWRAFAPHHQLVPDSSFTPPLKERLLARLRASSLSHDSEAVVEAMVLGSKDNITPELRDIYAEAGGSHLLALSGLHLGIVAGVLMLLLGHSYRRRLLRLVVALPLVWGYVWLTGAPPSLVRAATMLSAWLLAESVDRNVEGRDSLTVAVLAILAVRPFWLFDTGFQLSAVSMLGLTSINLVKSNSDFAFRFKSRVLRYFTQLVLAGAVATIATAPIVAATFHRLPLWGWMMSMVYIPITTFVVPCSMLLIACPIDALATAIDAALRLQLWLMQHTGAAVDNLYPSWTTVACAYALMLLFVYRRYVAMSFACATLLLSLVADRRVMSAPEVCFEDARATIVHSRSTIHRLPCADTTFYHDGFYACGGISILRASDQRWRHTSRPAPLAVDYLWVCRGYNGHMQELLQSVSPQCVVLDASLSQFFRTRFLSECDSIGLDCRISGLHQHFR